MNIVKFSPRRSRGNYSTIFSEHEENNCLSIIAQVIFRETAFSFILFVSSSKTLRNRAVAILENMLFSIIITSRGVIIAKYDVILDQSEREHFYNHVSNYTNVVIFQRIVFPWAIQY